MKPETILQSDVLDIIFEGRNKDYGAYALRKTYDRRLIQSLGIMVLMAGTFLVLQNMKIAGNDLPGDFLTPDSQFIPIELSKQDIKEDKPVEKAPAKKTEPRPTIDNTTYIIKKDKDVPETKIPPIDDLEGKVISDKTIDIPGGIGGNIPGIETTVTGTGTNKIADDPVITDKGPLTFAEVMPSFNGDIVKYMLRHLRQPDDLEEGERIVVRVKFVVNAEGDISDVEVMQSGRADLDAEVVRVVRKMPRWIPGQQAGRSVPVFFNMPVTFVSNP